VSKWLEGTYSRFGFRQSFKAVSMLSPRQSTDRDSWVVNRALEAFVDSEAWQIDEIKRGIAEADADEFASEAEVAALFGKWRRLNPDAD